MRRISLFWFGLFFVSALWGAPQQTQNLELAPGWNAVWLSVEPQKIDGTPAAPETVFAGHPEITTVSRFLPARAPVQYIEDPDLDQLGGDFWLTWRRDTLVGANTLGSLSGNTAYLIENSGTQVLNVPVTGEVRFHRYEWVPEAYNFFGVPTGATPPTFGDFFGPSPAHALDQVFRLENGTWTPVNANERMRQNEAYWVFCREGSRFQGPLPFVFPSTDGRLDYGTKVETIDVSGGNLLDESAALHLVRVVQDGFDLFDTASAGRIVDYAVSAAGGGSGDLAPKTSASLRLEAERNWSGGADSRMNLYRVEGRLPDGSSYFQYLPVRAAKPAALPAAGQSGDPLPGLWVGEVVLTHSTSAVEGKTDSGSAVGPRLEPVKRPLRYRILLHVDGGGAVRLLSDATVMQRTVVDEGIPPEYVIVLNEADIPNFVGIEERGGRLVGQRFDTAAYDLPRAVIPSASSDSDPNFDPSTLSTDYLESLPLTGDLVPGGLITTTPGSFTLDPWHRTNPYRHVFHPDHRRGFRVTREWALNLDAVGSEAAGQVAGFGATSLSGVFSESVTGLGKAGETLQSRGRFRLQRVNEVPTLD
jgi:hypothetical protein